MEKPFGMETILCSRNYFSPIIKLVDSKFGIFFSFRHFYINSFNEGSKIIVESKDVIDSYDIFYTSTDTYIVYATRNGSLYVMSGIFFPYESTNVKGTYQIIKPNFHKQIWTSSSPFELITINSENMTCLLLKSITDFDKKLTSYRINVNNNKFSIELLWIYDYNHPESPMNEHFGDIRLGATIKSFIIASHSIKERLSLANKTFMADEKLIEISDSLFVNLFGSRNNLEGNLIVFLCFPNGIINWITGNACTNISLNVLWNMQEEIINIHNTRIKKLNKKGIPEEINCLLIIGKSGSFVIFGPQQYPANIGFQVHFQINSTDMFDDNLLFSTYNGIFTLNLSDILKEKVDNCDKIIPKLISPFKVRSFKIDQHNSCKDNIRIFACSFDNRIVKFSVSTTQVIKQNICQAMKESKKIKHLLTSIDSLTKQNEDSQKTCDILSKDFTNLCVASHILHTFKDNENVKIKDQDSSIKIISDLNLDIYTEYKCLNTKDDQYNITLHFQFSNRTLKSDSNYSFVAHILPSKLTSTFPRGIFKTAHKHESTSHTTDGLMILNCSLSFICTLSMNIFPLSISTYLCLDFNPINNLQSLMIPLKKFEAGILKFVSPDLQLHCFKFSKNLNADEIIKLKHTRNNFSSLPAKVTAVIPSDKWESVKVVFKNKSHDGIWKDLFKGNMDIHETLFASNVLNFHINGNIPLKLEINADSPTKPFIIISSTSLRVVSSVHREVVLILYKAANLSFPQNTMLPILEVADYEIISNKLMRLDTGRDFDSTFESDDHRLLHCYQMHRGN